MIVEKPPWLRHGGLQIFSLDIQSSGLRLATAGGDHKVRIWNMKPLSARESDVDFTSPKLLATLRDHFGSVNCVRWAKSGRFIASGSDDNLVLIHERKPGSGTVEFGSGEPPNVENWKVTMTLRGHSADVVDLGWSPDDSMLASCSLDNTVRIWRTADGSSVTVLNSHKSLVKGVAWDPIGSFLASQSDDKTVVIWQTNNWTLSHRAEGPWEKTVSSTFFRRLGWSPCGHFLTTTHGFQKPSHTAPVLERGNWSATFNFVGHNAAVVAVRFNHSVFRKQPQSDSTGSMPGLEANNLAQAAIANGGSKGPSKEASVYNVIALGSQDCYITVWTTASPRPVFVGKHFFNQSVVDLSWSPDGYSLYCCSLDGSVSVFHFEPKELGQKISDAEMQDFKKSRYGDLQGRQLVLAESPAQLTLEAAASKKVNSESNDAKKCSGVVPAAPNGAPKSSDHVAMHPGLEKGSVPVTTPEKIGPLASPQPVKQREYRQPDGRRRIIPEALGVITRDDNIANGGGITRLDLVAPTVISGRVDDKPENAGIMISEVGEKRRQPEEVIKDLFTKKSNGASNKRGLSSTANSSAVNVVNIDVGSDPGNRSELYKGTSDVTRARGYQVLAGVLSIKVRSSREVMEGLGPICLEARPANFAEIDKPGAESLEASRMRTTETNIICSQGGEIRWSDRLAGKAKALTGNSNFWAVGCEDGSLQVYTAAGRRAFPSMWIGSGVAFLDCNYQWKLLSLTTGGILHVWDLLQQTCILQESVIPLLKGYSSSMVEYNNTIKIISARLSSAGSPIIVLANHHAFLFQLNMRCWLRVADDMFPASEFSSTVSEEEGELASLQAAAAVGSGRNFMRSRSSIDEKCQTRAHLEAQMAAALALESAAEYRRYLLAYTRFLTREGDEARLRELCEILLGPPHVPVKNDSVSSCVGHWDARLIGMKKHDLLRSEVLPAMASNRAVQRLLNEFIDLLSEFDARQPNSPPSTRES
ncbi:hypothetical protein O6H91_01G044100 [Diphasiastrum complanatum]|uniref:Uncharacterized protein n=7 Tax=Diphasiastrum complanatum TaxID=34168 RepID=A0ACC2EQN0_DIPCM|nr:hypothetical protein O6H91_01G044100 [Diphasiastrum complanatum]KAJ7568687.1 hypothetical protein O6H91_01G044100 [Diphasiastrum complanatum]KAJ7568688.1 hypothetical protein O6H91_01G044100 [Diphasiastrum complanatum]KAJ7568689.1 hypothetical protein O6H91_01G044100 [Diphasiastrum complanatum]KAJ7568692.1 hypothetical protein O6H91_01G044100 [Diphasiastrum complanatum]